MPHASSFHRIDIGTTIEERMGRKGTGVQIRGKAIRIQFRLNGDLVDTARAPPPTARRPVVGGVSRRRRSAHWLALAWWSTQQQAVRRLVHDQPDVAAHAHRPEVLVPGSSCPRSSASRAGLAVKAPEMRKFTRRPPWLPPRCCGSAVDPNRRCGSRSRAVTYKTGNGERASRSRSSGCRLPAKRTRLAMQAGAGAAAPGAARPSALQHSPHLRDHDAHGRHDAGLQREAARSLGDATHA